MNNITLQQIQIFLTVAEYKVVSKAAELLFISQPTVSKWIGRLENELGVRLFTRTHTGMILTREGEFLYSEWSPLYGRLMAAAENLGHLNATSTKAIRIGCLNSYGTINTTHRIVEVFKKQNQDIEVAEELYDFAELRRCLVSGDIDFAASVSFALDGVQDISCMYLKSLSIYIGVGAQHPLAANEELSIKDLKDETFYVLLPYAARSGSDRVLKRCLASGFYPKTVHYVPNISSLIVALKEGRGVTICGRIVSEKDEGEIKLFPIEEEETDAYTTLAWRTGDLSAPARKFINCARNII